jgi:DNA replication and repair protein RecF
MLEILAVEKLDLINFRNYSQISLKLEAKPIIITGPNGSGKTNILEAISFLSPGRGLRNAKLKDIDNKNTNLTWKVRCLIKSTIGRNLIETGRVQNNDSYKRDKRFIKIDDIIAKSASEISNIFSVIWLVPQLDQIFMGASSERRKFFDRMVYNFDPNHASHVIKYDYYMRERFKLLKTKQYDTQWLSIIEQHMAEMGVAIAAARMQSLAYIQHCISEAKTSFPKPHIYLTGEIETMIDKTPAIEIEEYFKEILSQNRQKDTETNQTNFGVHKSDMITIHDKKNLYANLCSTGEQKAMLVAITLAEARARIKWRSSVPILLLDEVMAHLDERRRTSLFDEILHMKAQCWITGTDDNMFQYLNKNAQYLHIKNGAFI